MKNKMVKSKPLYIQWAEFFKKKIMSDFSIDVTKAPNYQIDVAPLIYCCLLHRRVPVKKWNVILSQEFQDSDWAKKTDWLNIKNKLESGEDINPYMSKSLKDWAVVDYLLYTYKIHHFHLYKNNDGGIRNELVFGIFHKNTFYVLDIKGHNEIYSADTWVKIINNNWVCEEVLSNVEIVEEKSQIFDQKNFKRTANNPNLQFNNINPLQISNDEGGILSLQGQQHTSLIDFSINDIKYPKVPMQAYCAYNNEIEHLKSIEEELIKRYGYNCTFDLNIDIKSKKYKIILKKQILFPAVIKFKEKGVIVSLYHEQKYYPYYS